MVSASTASATELITAMDDKGVDVTILMATPGALEDTAADTTSDLEAFFPSATYGSRIKFMYGGAELNYLLHGANRHDSVSDSTRWDATGSSYSVYPLGCPDSDCSPLSAGLATAVVIETDTTSTYYDQFIALATAAASSGQYVGFGEIGALHYAQRAGHPYIHFPANDTWLKGLSDIAATSGMPIDLHLELDAASQTQLEELLAYNRSTKIILQHAGWSTYGTATASVLSSLMAANSNLYLTLKKCHDNGVDACYLDSAGDVKTEWVTLITTYSSRIMLGTDAKYWEDSYSVKDVMNRAYRDKSTPGDRLGDLKLLMDYFYANAPTVAADLEGGTARTVFGF